MQGVSIVKKRITNYSYSMMINIKYERLPWERLSGTVFWTLCNNDAITQKERMRHNAERKSFDR